MRVYRKIKLSMSKRRWGVGLAGQTNYCSAPHRHRHIYLHLLGYLLFLAVRVWGTSFNIIFNSFIGNNIATALGIALCLFLFVNDERTPVISHSGVQAKEFGTQLSTEAKYPGLVVASCGFGALMFLTMLLFGEVSVVSRWAVAPYPDIGPYPMPWG